MRLPAPPPAGAKVRGRVSEYALLATNSSFVTIANLTFRATTMAANGDVANITLRSLEFNYSATSRRSLTPCSTEARRRASARGASCSSVSC